MSAEQIRHWAREGIEFGAHSRTHRDLTTLGHAELREEILGARDDLERLNGAPPISFAYPFGFFNDEVVAVARSGFSLAMSCYEGLNDLATDTCLLRRTMVRPSDTLVEIEFRAALGHNPLQRLRRAMRLRTRLGKAAQVARRMTRTMQSQP